jgi:GTPase SAR1 family protein
MERKVVIKMIIIGDVGVGKTSLQNQWTLNRLLPSKTNIGCDFFTKDILIKNIPTAVQVWGFTLFTISFKNFTLKLKKIHLIFC